MLQLAAAAALIGAAYAQNSSLPTVDLGYEIYQASGFNVRQSSLGFDVGLLTDPGYRQLLQLLQHTICCSARWQPEVCTASGSSRKQINYQHWKCIEVGAVRL